jgi:hypothetical protein
VFLKPGSPSLHKAPGRRLFNSTALANSIKGIAYCPFDNATDLLACVSGGSYYTAPAGETGTLTSLATGAGNSLSTVSVNNRSVLLSGGTNKVLLADGTARPHGLNPVTGTPRVTTTTSGGAWPLGATGVPKYYDYWTTEVYKTDTEEIESTFTGVPFTAFVSTTAYYNTVNRPQVENESATHWRVYRSNPKSLSTDEGFPIGFLIGELLITSSSFNDGLTVAATKVYPSSTQGTSRTEVFPNVTYVAWTNPANLTASDATYATGASSLTETVVPGPPPNTISRNIVEAEVYGYSVTGVNAPITDIAVEVKGYHDRADGHIAIALTWDSGQHWTGYQYAYLGIVSGSPQTVTLSGLWGRTWSTSDIAAANFRVSVSATNTATGTVNHNLDYAAITFTHSGTTAATTVQFPRIIISAGPVKASVGANAKPPNATIGDVFQGSLVMNDPDNPRIIRWTIPNEIDYSPVIYEMAFDLGVTGISALGSICLIGQTGQVERLNYLPLEDDAEFNPHRARESVDSDDGMVGGRAYCKFTLNGQLRLFYVGYTSLRMSNGLQAETATDDIVWIDMTNKSVLSQCHVENNAIYHEILVHYPATGSSAINKTLRLSYDPVHIKNGKLKVCGITDYAAVCSTSGISDSNERVVYTGTSAGTVYVENRGYSDASGGGIVPRWQTREMHQNGFGGSWEITGLGVAHQAEGGDLDTAFVVSQGNYPNRTGDTTTASMSEKTISWLSARESGDGIGILQTGRDDSKPMTVDFLVIDAESLGEAVPLKR